LTATSRLAFAIALALASCDPFPPPVSPDPAPADCEQACQRLEALECTEAEPAADGTTCVDLCREVETSGYSTLNLSCVLELDSCDLESCAYEAK
jgi:hypothetical protein